MARSCLGSSDMGGVCSRRHSPADPLLEAEPAAEPVLSSSGSPADPLPEAEPAAEPFLSSSGDDAVVTPRGARRAHRTLVDQRRVRFYAVWHVAGARYEIVGVHSGTIVAWRHIAAALPGGRYLPGHRLRRYKTLEEAVDGYYAEAVRHRAPIPPNLYVHQ
jgi:hypothetical protein